MQAGDFCYGNAVQINCVWSSLSFLTYHGYALAATLCCYSQQFLGGEWARQSQEKSTTKKGLISLGGLGNFFLGWIHSAESIGRNAVQVQSQRDCEAASAGERLVCHPALHVPWTALRFRVTSVVCESFLFYCSFVCRIHFSVAGPISLKKREKKDTAILHLKNWFFQHWINSST